MTSNTTPEGICSASSYISGYDPWRAFTPNIMDSWQETHNQTASNIWVQYSFTRAVKIYKAQFSTYNNSSISYKFRASNDGNNWTDISPVYNNVSGGTYNLNTSDKYITYRLLIISQTLTGGWQCGRVNKFQLYGREDI